MVTFRLDYEDSLMDGSKTQTIRRNAARWARMAGYNFDIDKLDRNTILSLPNKSDNPLHLHLTNPRYRSPSHRKLGISTKDWRVMLLRGHNFNDKIAVDDGFGTEQELRNALMKLNGMTANQVDNHIWAVITWEWKEGPN